jgi:hypothetical protein
LKYTLKIACICCSIATIVVCLGIVALFKEFRTEEFANEHCTDLQTATNLEGLGGIVESLSKENIIVGLTTSIDGVVEVVVNSFTSLC